MFQIKTDERPLRPVLAIRNQMMMNEFQQPDSVLLP